MTDATPRHCLVLCTVPDRETGGRIARTLVEESLAACVNIQDGLTSVYRWQGEIQTDAEALLLIKSRLDRFDALARRLRALHPYELPEIIAVPITSGLADYLAWIDATLDAEETT